MQHPPGKPAIDDGTAVTRSGQSVFMSVYKTRVADQCWLITVTWCKNMLLHGLSVSVDRPHAETTCKVELKPWYFWRKQGSKRFVSDGKAIDVFWDLKAAKFHGETEPSSEYYVAVVCDEEVVLLLGDLKKDAYRKTGCRPALIDPILVSRKEHVFGKKKFVTRIKFHETGRFHEISIESKNTNTEHGADSEMEIRIDGHLMVHVKHLQWKFRGNESINFKKVKIEVYWDVHDWLFSPGLRHALFIINSTAPVVVPPTSTPSSLAAGGCGSSEGFNPNGFYEFCLFLYAWKVE
ncbi:uncharacterized protein LOC112514877 [Cynara cardunculus var. scolymus]|uniref:DUF868 domain-containing protein n=1 Tax=Cynara cardunculus var. scolymus TaxID=59895 RepID=A0A118JZK4_CYNCS|nr:uncharacterized protein LOC112514877 [Cynara cardunculus var. scolymus]KVH98920.1 Protein of unknown function DUF868, plant [Cynara cardunculus var. scolymus]